MIWSEGRVAEDDAIAVGLTDRTFEHGLGLFETLRTWEGRPVFLDAHRSRMLASAETLGIPIDPGQFPAEADVAHLLEAEGAPPDRLLRVTLTGGGREAPRLWIRSGALPATREAIRVELGSWAVPRGDVLARHKTLNYWSRRIVREDATRRGFDETLGSIAGGGFCEAASANLFVIRRGELLTPSLDAPILPGIMRRFVLDLARELTIAAREVDAFASRDIESADEVFLTNAVRGILPVKVVLDPRSGREREWPTPGPVTGSLRRELAARLLPGGYAT